MYLVCIVGKRSLYKVSDYLLPYCWYSDISPQCAEGREDGLVYVSGHKTEEEAMDAAKRKGWLND